MVTKSGTGEGLAMELAQFTKDRKISMVKVKSLISDGCKKMVGWKCGVHASLEMFFGVPFVSFITWRSLLRWFSCSTLATQLVLVVSQVGLERR